MNSGLSEWMNRYDALTLRERALIALTLFVLLGFGWWMLFYEDIAPEIARLEQANQRLSTEVTSLRKARDSIRQRLDQGVHRQQQEQVAALQRELAQLKQKLSQGTRGLVAPREMLALMRQMIDAAPGLRLLELRRSAVEPLLPSPAAKDTNGSDKPAPPGSADGEAAQPGLYRHVMQVRLEGRYRDILDWLQQLEQLPWQLIWNRVELQAGDYPKIEVKLTLSTVSSSRAWVRL